MEFVELCARSNFSFLQGASHPEEMVKQAQLYNYQGLGLCDLNGLYGVARGFRETTQKNSFDEETFSPREDFRFHVGVEMTLREGNVCLLPKTKKGYSNICRLVTSAKKNASKGFTFLKDQDLFTYPEEVVAIPFGFLSDERFDQFQNVYGSNLFLPVTRDFTWENEKIFLQNLNFEKTRNANLFVTQRPWMHSPARKKIHDVITCIYHKVKWKEAGLKILQNAERSLHLVDDLEKIYSDRPDLIERTVEISSMLEFSLKEIKYQYPKASLPIGITTSMDYLKHLCTQAIPWRFPDGITEKHQTVLEKEFRLIKELKYEDYFLTLWEICEFAKQKDILFQGRGSAANSLVCFLLGLTSVNPDQVDLLFERFISLERQEPPDIDIDFEHERREEVIQHIYEKYTTDRAGMVCNVICYRGRLAIREICKVLEVSEVQITKIVQFMGREGLSRLEKNKKIFEQFEISKETFQLILELVTTLRGFPRHLGIHSGGFVLSENQLIDSIPVEKATMEDRFVVQWNKDDIETLGLLKVDFLSLGMLTAIQKSLKLLAKHKNLKWNLAQVPTEDSKTYAMIQKAETVGVFQIESRAQMSLLPRLKPKTYYDLVVEVAIVRPGPIQGGMIHPYLKRRDGLEEITYPHPRLIPILGKTCGVPIFQEQIMQVVVAVAGFTPGEADQMRRIMSNAWRKKSQLNGIREKLYKGMTAEKIPADYIEKIYHTIEGFAAYGFPESHAASFALLTYVSCYLKCHHPDVFACAMLNSQPLGFYSPRTLIRDAMKNGVQFLPLSLHLSSWEFDMVSSQTEDSFFRVRVGFCTLQGVAENELRKILASREQLGKFDNLEDFIRRVQIKPSALARLAVSGAFSDFGYSPREALWEVQARHLDPNHLFFGRKMIEAETYRPPPSSDWDALKSDYQHLGFSIETHPLELLRAELACAGNYVRSEELTSIPNKKMIRFVGLLSVQQKPPTAKGVSFLTLEDEFGFFNIVLMPPVYEKYRLLTRTTPLLEIFGQLEKVGEVIHVIAQTVAPFYREKIYQHEDLSNPVRFFH